MTDREKLIELFKGAENKVMEELNKTLELEEKEWMGIYADHLLANGVIVPSCKVGDTVYCFEESHGDKITNLTNALDLITRLQTENKRLTTLAELGNKRANDYRVMRDRALKAEAENERLKKIKENSLKIIKMGEK